MQGHADVVDLLVKAYGKHTACWLECCCCRHFSSSPSSTISIPISKRNNLYSFFFFWFNLSHTRIIGADSNMRDYSGKKPHQYLSRPDTVISIDTFRSEYSNSTSSKSSFSSFERGGLYSSTKAVLKNSLLKLTPGHHHQPSSTYSESSSIDSINKLTGSTESCTYSLSEQDSLTLRSNPEKKRQLIVSQSMLRELRPSIRRRAHSSSAFVNNTT